MIKFFIIFFALVIFIQVVFKNKTINSKWLNYFKFLFPSWCFFDESSDTPVILYRTMDMKDFQIALEPHSINLLNIFSNPRHNLYMNFNSVQQQLLNEIYDNQNNKDFNLKELPSFKLALSFIRNYILNNKNIVLDVKFSFIKKNDVGFIIQDSIFEIEGISNES